MVSGCVKWVWLTSWNECQVGVADMEWVYQVGVANIMECVSSGHW